MQKKFYLPSSIFLYLVLSPSSRVKLNYLQFLYYSDETAAMVVLDFGILAVDWN